MEKKSNKPFTMPFKAGYRIIEGPGRDLLGCRAGVGRAIAKADVAREDLFITTRSGTVIKAMNPLYKHLKQAAKS